MEINVKLISRPLVKINLTKDNGNPTEHDARSVKELELSVRAEYFLNNAGIDTVGELRRKTKEAMRSYRNLGNKTTRELQEKLGHLGITVHWIEPKKSCRPVSKPVS